MVGGRGVRLFVKVSEKRDQNAEYKELFPTRRR